MQWLPLKEIRLDGGTQPREKIDPDVVQDYADALGRGDKFPPAKVFDDGRSKWLADGFHRYRSHEKAGKTEMLADVEKGMKRDAVLFSLQANAAHGLRRSNADKRRAVLIALKDPELGTFKNTQIARLCAVAESFVRKVKAELNGQHQDNNGVGNSSHCANSDEGGEEKNATQADDADSDTDQNDSDADETSGGSQSNGKPSLTDALDRPVPAELEPVFERAAGFKGIVNRLNAINRELEELHKGPAGSPGRLQGEQIDLKNLKESVHFDTPYAVCPVCKGAAKGRKPNCPCKGRGWLVQTAYKNLPSEFRE